MLYRTNTPSVNQIISAWAEIVLVVIFSVLTSLTLNQPLPENQLNMMVFKGTTGMPWQVFTSDLHPRLPNMLIYAKPALILHVSWQEADKSSDQLVQGRGYQFLPYWPRQVKSPQLFADQDIKSQWCNIPKLRLRSSW